MREVRLWLSQEQIPRRPIGKISKVIKNSPREDMSLRGVPLGDKGVNPRMQRHDVNLASGAWRTSAVGKVTRHFKKSAKKEQK